METRSLRGALPAYEGFCSLLSPTLFFITMSSRRPPLQMHPLPSSSKPKRRTDFRVSARYSRTRSSLSAQEYFESFLRKRQASGDFISKASDILWKRQVLEADKEKWHNIEERLAAIQKIKVEEQNTGFLKLGQVKSWDLGLDIAPTNARFSVLEVESAQEDRRHAGFLEYAPLKRELLLVTIGIAAASSLYCLLVFSPKIALSYGVGAVGSIIYLQLLYDYVDKVSRIDIAKVFRERGPKRIGIRSNDVQEFFQRAFYGSTLALSSPRLVIPVLLFGSWVVCHNSANESFDLQLVPLMLGFFAYKAATWFQVYRENKD